MGAQGSGLATSKRLHHFRFRTKNLPSFEIRDNNATLFQQSLRIRSGRPGRTSAPVGYGIRTFLPIATGRPVAVEKAILRCPRQAAGGEGEAKPGLVNGEFPGNGQVLDPALGLRVLLGGYVPVEISSHAHAWSKSGYKRVSLRVKSSDSSRILGFSLPSCLSSVSQSLGTTKRR